MNLNFFKLTLLDLNLLNKYLQSKIFYKIQLSFGFSKNSWKIPNFRM